MISDRPIFYKEESIMFIIKMKKIIILLTIGFIAHTNCYGQSMDTLVVVKEQNCEGEIMEIYLPQGWVNNQRKTYENGFTKTYFYSDNAHISLICGDNPNNGDWEVLQSCGMNFRDIFINGITIVYGNVMNERKPVFDKAFDKTSLAQ